MTNRWLLARFDTLGGIAVFACTILVLYSRTSAGLGGVSLSFLTRSTAADPLNSARFLLDDDPRFARIHSDAVLARSMDFFVRSSFFPRSSLLHRPC